MDTKKVNVQMLEPQPTNGIRTIDTTSSQTIAKPTVSSRSRSKELFEKHSTFKDAAAWHTWKMSFDIGRNYSKDLISNFIIEISQQAEVKFNKNKHRPLSEASIEAETIIFVCKGILAAMNGC